MVSPSSASRRDSGLRIGIPLAIAVAVGILIEAFAHASSTAEQAVYVGAATALVVLLLLRGAYALFLRHAILSGPALAMEHRTLLLRAEQELTLARRDMDELVRTCEPDLEARLQQLSPELQEKVRLQINDLLESTTHALLVASADTPRDPAHWRRASRLLISDLLTNAALDAVSEVTKPNPEGS